MSTAKDETLLAFFLWLEIKSQVLLKEKTVLLSKSIYLVNSLDVFTISTIIIILFGTAVNCMRMYTRIGQDLLNCVTVNQVPILYAYLNCQSRY